MLSVNGLVKEIENKPVIATLILNNSETGTTICGDEQRVFLEDGFLCVACDSNIICLNVMEIQEINEYKNCYEILADTCKLEIEL